MISFFLPHKNGSNADHLREVGLDMLLREGDEAPRFADLDGPGPGDKPGQIVSWSGEGLSYLPEQQEWYEIPACRDRNLPKGRYWIGTLKGIKASPADFVRRNKVDGAAELLLCDGNRWTVPNSASFPMQFGLGDEGEMKKIPRADFVNLFNRTIWAMKLLEQSLNDGSQIDEEQSLDYCVELLSLNYRINREIVLWLGLFDPNNLSQFMMFTTDYIRITEIYEDVKKKALA